MAESPRIEELRRRVQSDPASIAFAALAEEYRRAGRFEEAIAACVTGLQRHPSYLSAHVTLGRSLLEVGRYQEAQDELEHVLKLAPENLAAIRGLADIQHRRGDDLPGARAASSEAVSHQTAAPPPAPLVPVQPAIADHPLRPPTIAAPAASGQLSVAAEPPEPVRAAPEVVSASGPPIPVASQSVAPALEPPEHAAPELGAAAPAPELAALEEFLSTILRARADRSAGR